MPIIKTASHRTVVNKDKTPGLMAYNETLGENRRVRVDDVSDALVTISHDHSHVHEGKAFYLVYSVASVGALTTPDDTMTLSFKTPAASSGLFHLIVFWSGEQGTRCRIIEGKSGGGANPTGTLDPVNTNRSLASTASAILAVDGTTADKISYDATVFTGGTTIWDEYLPGARGVSQGQSRGTHELILATSTFYQVSLVEAGTVPGTIQLEWYEHISSAT
jgi:hypothetical protein